MSALGQIIPRGSALWAQIALAIASVVPLLGLPIIVGALADRWGYSPMAAGYIAACDLAGMCVGSVLTSALAHRLHWRGYVGAAIVAGVSINLLCAAGNGFWLTCALRLTAGSVSGAIYAVALVLLSRGRDASRNFSVMIFAAVVANAIVLALFPVLATRWGPAALFIFIALALAAVLLVVPALPAEAPVVRPQIATGSARRIATLPMLCLLAVALFYVTIGSYWTYAERMGLESGLSPGFVHQLLSMGVLLSGAGCLLAFWLSRRVGQSRPLLIALLAL